MKKITLFFVLISTGLFSQSLQMPNIPSEGVTYQTSYINAYLNVSSTGPWDFTNLNPVDQSEVSLQSIEDSNFSTAVYPNTTHIKYGTDLIQYPGFTTSGYTYNGENSIIITKLDGTAKGGVLVPIAQQLSIPISYIGVGEQKEDLLDFNADNFSKALLDIN